VTALLSTLSHYRDQEIGGTPFGESVQSHYFRTFGLRKHSTASQIQNAIGEEEWASYFKFGFVRDPISRLASAFHFLKKWDGLPQQYRDRLEKFADLESFLSSGVWMEWRGPDDMFLPQSHWLSVTNSGVDIDFVGKVENIESDLVTIAETLGVELPLAALKKMNQSTYNPTHVGNSTTLRQVGDYYKTDYELFGYERLS
jgi:hypothetical protein